MANSWESLIDQWDERLRRAFLDSIYGLRDTAHLDQIVTMLENGDVNGALRAVGIDPAQFRPFDKTIADAFEAGGNATANLIPVVRDAAGFRTVFQFSVRNLTAEAWLRDHSSTLIKEIVDDQRDMIRSYLTDALAKGLNPRTAALDLVGRINKVTGRREGGTIGLTSSQEEWVRSYAADLASENPLDALSRSLRDKRFDGAVRNAAKNSEPVPAELRSKMVTAYRNRALRFRAEAIARSEAITALHKAQDMSLDQAVNSGAVRADAVSIVWRSAHDSRVRDAHRELDGQKIRKGGVFQSSLGPIRFPGDPNASPANTVNCRCVAEPSIDFLVGVR